MRYHPWIERPQRLDQKFSTPDQHSWHRRTASGFANRDIPDIVSVSTFGSDAWRATELMRRLIRQRWPVVRLIGTRSRISIDGYSRPTQSVGAHSSREGSTSIVTRERKKKNLPGFGQTRFGDGSDFVFATGRKSCNFAVAA